MTVHWLQHVLGLDNPSGPWELFWSGFGSDLGEWTIAATPFVLWRRHNCHVKRCWRIGRHRVEGTPFVVCRRHHPDDHVTAQDVAAAAAKARGAP